MTTNRRPSFVRDTLLVLLAAAVVLAQSAGLTHRIEHGPGSAAYAERVAHFERALAEPAQERDAQTPAHDCALFDAATLNDAPPQAIVLTGEVPPQATHAAGQAVVVLSAEPALGYASRAPPRA